MSISSCPRSCELAALARGELPAAQVDDLAHHLEGCAECAAAAAGTSGGDTLAEELRQAATTPDLPRPDQEAVDRLVERISGPSAGGDEETLTTRDERSRTPDESGAGSSRLVLTFLAPAQRPDEIGRLGPYRVLRVLGRGGMGAVLQAEDPSLDRVVALKVMLPEVAQRPGMKQRFLREARAAARIEHDHIIPIHQVDEQNGVPYIAMPFLQGCSLEDWLKKKEAGSAAPAPPMTVPQVLKIAREITRGLMAAHEKGLIHRDIKPANLWLDSAAGGRVKILDFGLARLSTGAGEQNLTQSGVILGTPSYMAPEQARSETVDGRADLFSLGVVLYRLCTGVLPFQGHDAMSTLLSVTLSTPTPPVDISPGLPAAISMLVMSLLEKDPEKRPASAREVLRLLQGIEKDLADPAARADATRAISHPGAVATPAPATAPQKRKPRRILVACAAAFLAALVLAAIVLFWQTPNGTVRIEINDPEIKVAIDQDVFKITGAGPHDVVLSPGEHSLRVQRGDLELETDRFVIRKRETVTLRIELLQGKVQVAQGDRVIGQKGPQVAQATPKNAGATGQAPPASPGWKATPEQQQWLDSVAGMEPYEQIEAVRKKMVEENPGFVGKGLTGNVEAGRVVHLSIDAAEVTRIWPVRAFRHLNGLHLFGPHGGRGKLADLSPLQGMQLTTLMFPWASVKDLTPLQGMPLTELGCLAAPIRDFSPLMGMRLTRLDCSSTGVTDLSPWRGCR